MGLKTEDDRNVLPKAHFKRPYQYGTAQYNCANTTRELESNVALCYTKRNIGNQLLINLLQNATRYDVR